MLLHTCDLLQTQPTHAARRCRPTCQLPVTIDAAFVQFVHTQSLELHVWRGDRGDWPAGGTACGVARVVLRSLLTTLGGVGSDVTIASEASGGDCAGSMTVRLCFKHRGLGSSSDDAAVEQSTGRLRVSASATGEEDFEVAAETVHGEARGDSRRGVPASFRQAFDVLGEEQTGGPDGGKIYDDPATRHDGPETAKVTSRQASPSKSAGENPQQLAGAWEGARTPNSKSHRRPPAGSASSLWDKGGLRVHVERAMRLDVVASAAVASGDTEAGAVGSAGSPREALLPSTYVTFRWEEEGKQPLRSPLLLSPVLSTPPGGRAGVAGREDENRQVRFLFLFV